MRFIKENSYDIIRLMLNQLALAVFGIVLVFASTMTNDGNFGIFSLLASIFSVCFYLYILYATLLEIGQKHKISIESGKRTLDKNYGLKVMLCSQVVNMLVLVFMTIGWVLAFVIPNSAEVGLNIYTISHLIFYFIQSTYDGMIGYFLGGEITTSLQCLYLLIASICTIIPQVLVGFFSYRLGLEEKKLFFGKPPTSSN